MELRSKKKTDYLFSGTILESSIYFLFFLFFSPLSSSSTAAAAHRHPLSVAHCRWLLMSSLEARQAKARFSELADGQAGLVRASPGHWQGSLGRARLDLA